MKKKIIFTLFATISFSISVSAMDIDSMTLEELKIAYRELEAQYNELIGTESVDISLDDKNNTVDISLVTYDDILSGAYNGQRVYIDAVIDKLNIKSGNSCSFSLWYPNGDTYVYDDFNSFYGISENSPESNFLKYENGDLVRYETEIYNDGSFGIASLFDVQLTGEVNINDVYSAYKSGCSEFSYEDALRNPDNYSGTICKISGTIFQIIEEGSYSVEYLVSTNSGYVYANWYDDKEIRGSRFLEDDSVTLYGEFTGLMTYNTLSGENTVPNIIIHLIELK